MPTKFESLPPIEVTQEDIDNGQTGDYGNNCPIGLAVKRTLKLNSVHVYHNGIYFYDENNRPKIATLTPFAKQFMRYFDSGCHRGDYVRPFTFHSFIKENDSWAA